MTPPPPGAAGAEDPMLDVFRAGGEVGEQMLAHDWAATAVGPVEQWPQSLRTAVRIVLTSRFAMWMGWGPELTFFYNDKYRRDTLGIKHPWALGRPASEVWAEIWPEIGPRIATVLATGVATWDEDLQLFLHRSGYEEETYHTFSYSPLADDEGQVNGMLCVVTEETSRVIAARRLTTLRELASALPSSVTEQELLRAVEATLGANRADLPFTALYLFDDDGRARLAGSTGVEADHPAAPPTVGPHDDHPWPAAALLAHGESVCVDLDGRVEQLPTGAWSRPPTEGMAVPVARQGSPRPAGFLAVGTNPFRPLDEEQQGFLELVAGQIAAGLAAARSFEAERRRAEALAELDRAKTTFFTNISHEFRTPLTLLLAPVEEALSGASPEPLTPTQRQWVSVVHRNALRLSRLVNTLLDFSRSEAGRTRATFRPTDLAALTTDLASNFRAAVERAGMALVVECPPLDEPVWVDRDMWEKVVLNLLSNAFKYTLEGGIDVRLATTADGGVELRVSDTGPGIAEEELPRLFERFHRISVAQSRSHEGTGIGLALVKDLVELHGGSIEVETVVGEGSTFVVRLQRGTDHLPAESLQDADPSATSTSAAAHVMEALQWLDDDGDLVAADGDEPLPLPGGAMDTTGCRILVVDDNPDLRHYLARLLRQHWLVEEVADGQAAHDAAVADPPDLVLTDVMMPRVDGVELLARLRRDPRTTTVPVIMLSARAGEEAAIEGLQAGADDYLVKPFAARELLARVRANLEMSLVRQRAARRAELHVAQLRSLADAAVALGGAHTADEVCTMLEQWVATVLDRPVEDAPARSLTVTCVVHGDEGPPRSATEIDSPVGDGPRRELTRPLVATDGRELGVLVVATDGDGCLDEEDEALVRQLAQLASLRLDGVALFQQEHRIATILQRSLLPARLPVLDDAQLGARYLPGTTGLHVGGDWYDVLELPDGRTALTIGDVVGKGVEAAATMGQLRHAFRAYLLEGLAPGLALQRLDRLTSQLGQRTFATMLCLLYSPGTDEVRWASAGHPPPLVVHADGTTEFLEDGLSVPIGAMPDSVFVEATSTLAPGDTLLLYTDGLVEVRGVDLRAGMDRLARTAAASDGDVERLLDDVLDLVAHRERPDDTAVLALRSQPSRVGDPVERAAAGAS